MKYGGKAQSLPYTNPAEALDIISRWVQEQSNDQIKDVLTSLEDQTKLLVVSAASYKSKDPIVAGQRPLGSLGEMSHLTP